ncbi:hypothetical protein V1478_005598 [Vespula squamosa]|uniref:Uncharacterized protein n=1 Tax=Vespula squamosa TaxID=30214 RepID=A0ABD2BAH2_VESSQ
MYVKPMSVTISKNAPATRREFNEPIMNREVVAMNAGKSQKLYSTLGILGEAIVRVCVMKAARVLRRLLAEIKRRTDPVTVPIDQRIVSVVITRRQRLEIQK